MPGCPISRAFCEKWGFSLTSSRPSASAPPNLLFPPRPVVDPDWSGLSLSIPVATPLPILGTCHQPAHNRIAMHVLELLNLFLLAPQLEIVETALPELAGKVAFHGQSPGNAKLHGLNHL